MLVPAAAAFSMFQLPGRVGKTKTPTYQPANAERLLSVACPEYCSMSVQIRKDVWGSKLRRAEKVAEAFSVL